MTKTATSIRDILTEVSTAATDKRDKGERFERLIAAFFRTDPEYAARFSNVWLWQEWPGRGGKVDTGIDLVAEERETGGLTAIQCKFYDPSHTLQKSDIDSFFTASGKEGFTGRMVVSTTDKWSKHAEEALENQAVPVTRLGVYDLDNSRVDWSKFSLRKPEDITLRAKKELWQHQQTALERVRDGFSEHDRGKLIMACGTGKTFTSLRIAEDLVKPGGTVLFLVPSISLLSQTLTEWSGEANLTLRRFAVCSDAKVGKRRREEQEDIAPHDLALPATTDAAKLHAKVCDGSGTDQLTVIFSTYQSLPVVAEAQQLGVPEFGIVICDEAHRTTGATLVGEDESNFVRIHDADYVKASRRLYMTATPRIYDDSSKAKAGEADVVLASMDNEDTFGPEFHRLGFGEAVSKGLLTDYKVLVLAVDEKAVSSTFQAQLADEHHELRLDDAAKIVGCWNGLAKRGKSEADSDFGADTTTMSRAVAFARSIKDSQRFARLFTDIIDQYVEDHDLADDDEPLLRGEAEHVDGTFNVLERNAKLDWLKAGGGPNTCRVLSNARCLTEGVDVPALDAVIFLNPRNSVVDVVQSVGRVMRRLEGKDYGYVILPVGIPADMSPEQALADNEKYKVVWQVLQALRAHDERFNAMVNQIDLNKDRSDKLQVIGVGGFDDEDGASSSAGTAAPVQGALAFPDLGEWRDAIYARIVQKVGARRYWEDWAKDIADIAARHTTRIKALLDDPSLGVAGEFDAFLHGLRRNLNDRISRDDASDMLAQHLITRPVFDALFEDYSFAEHNPVSQVMQRMLDVLDAQHLDDENDTLKRFYDSVRIRVEGIDNAEGKQRIITELYERFFKLAFPKTAEQLGIVYTPTEIIDFILRSVEHALQAEFGASISDAGVHVLDPFTGTGTFITRLIQSGLIGSDDLARKYASELHANDILLLAYYIAAVNIEATYHGVVGGDYAPFEGIVLADTFQMTEGDITFDDVIFPSNNRRAAHQKGLDIRVIVGNPPYSAGQASINDDAANEKYPTLDASIARTYSARSTATNKNKLYDSYIRAIRWASDRILASAAGGVICFVTNGGYIDASTADGLRKTLVDEFHTIYCFNLRGNQRTAGDVSQREGGKIFGAGSRSTVAILMLVKRPGPSAGAQLVYRDIGDYLSRDEKLAIVSQSSVEGPGWQELQPNEHGDWVNQRNEGFGAFTPIGEKVRKGETRPLTIFDVYGGGLGTSRDAWVYNFSRASVETNVQRTIAFYNSQVEAFREFCQRRGATSPKQHVDAFIDLDPAKVSWSRSLKNYLVRGDRVEFDPDKVTVGAYRAFSKQFLYFDRHLNHERSQLPRSFPSPNQPNFGIVVTGVGAAMEFAALAVDAVPDMSEFGGQTNAQFFPRYTYPTGGTDGGLFDRAPAAAARVDNVTDGVLHDYQTTFCDAVTKDDIFYYVYGILHAPSYRQAYASDLKKMLPRIPKVATADDFHNFVDAGKVLVGLHIGYESADPYALDIEVKASGSVPAAELYRVSKMRFGKSGRDKDLSTVHYNSHIVVGGIPQRAHEYRLGSRSALEWVVDRYQVRQDKASGILNDPNDWAQETGDPRYILDLLGRLVTVSLRTVEVVESLPPLHIATSEASGAEATDHLAAAAEESNEYQSR